MNLPLKSWLTNWTLRPHHAEASPVRLTQRRVYILPTRQGLLFAATLFMMLIGSINYNLSLGYALTFLLAAMALLSMLHTFRNLAGLALYAGKAEPVFAGGTAHFTVRIENSSGLARYSVALAAPGQAPLDYDALPRLSVATDLAVPAAQRGVLRPGRFTLYTRYPLGLFHAWSNVELDMQCLVYPHPDGSQVAPPLAQAQPGSGVEYGRGEEDFAGLRNYQAGDTLKRIAWKAAARGEQLLTKEFSGRADAELWLDWEALPVSMNREARLSRLARWVLDATAAGLCYGLRLPGTTIQPASGSEQREHSLAALALFEYQEHRPAPAQAPKVERPIGLQAMLWVLLAFALAAAPHAGRLPWWIILLAGLLTGLRALIAQRALPLPRKALLLLAVAGASGGMFLSYGTLFGRDAGIALLILMLALKLMEMQTLRDAMLVSALCYFVVITNFFYTQSIPTAVYMLGVVWLITGTMIALQRTRDFDYRQIMPSAGSLLLQALPLMLALFVLFPRVQGPLWGLPQDAYAGVSGLSDSMAPGSVSQLSLSDAVAFRVKFDSALPKTQQLYWRGPVLWDFDGRAWSMGKPQPIAQVNYAAQGDPVRYTVTLEPHHQRWLFALDLPAQVPPASMITRDFQLLANAPVHSRLRYDMKSYLQYRAAADEKMRTLQRALQLPAGFNPRSRELALSWRRSAQQDNDLVQAALRYFREQPFFYTLNPPLLGANSVDDFLFETRRGFCEHYASSFVFLMRAAGVPARVVTGYQGGEVNPLGDFLTVRQTEAHAWAEVWLQEAGWVRVDPTAAVSPLRVEAGIAAGMPAGEPVPLLTRTDIAWLKRLRFTLDSVANTWNQWVLGYGPERQRQFLRSAGMSAATWQNMVQVLVISVTLVVAVIAALTLRRLHHKPHDAALALYLQFCAKLARRGIIRSDHEGPVDYCARVTRLRPDLAQQVQAISVLYVALRYGNIEDHSSQRMLGKLVRAFRA